MEELNKGFQHLTVGSERRGQGRGGNRGRGNGQGRGSIRGRGNGRGRGLGRGSGGRGRGAQCYAPNPDQTKQMVEYKKEINETCTPLVFVGGEADCEPLEKWEGITPSKCNVDDGISLMLVYKSKSDEIWESEYDKKVKGMQSKIQEDFKTLEAAHLLGAKITEESMRSLAIKFEFTSGKWMIPVPWNQADEVWKKLVQNLLDGKFPDHLGVRGLKVHGRKDAGSNPHNKVGGKIEANAMISVLTKDWTDVKKCKEVATILQSLGINYRLSYKSDLYTVCEIFRANIYKLRPSIYKVYERPTEDTRKEKSN